MLPAWPVIRLEIIKVLNSGPLLGIIRHIHPPVDMEINYICKEASIYSFPSLMEPIFNLWTNSLQLWSSTKIRNPSIKYHDTAASIVPTFRGNCSRQMKRLWEPLRPHASKLHAIDGWTTEAHMRRRLVIWVWWHYFRNIQFTSLVG